MKRSVQVFCKRAAALLLAFMCTFVFTDLILLKDAFAQGVATYTEYLRVQKINPEFVKEIKEERTEDKDVFLNKDGTYTDVYYSEPIRFQDENGEWVDIDTTLVEPDEKQQEEGYEWQTKSSDVEVLLAEDYASDKAITIRNPKYAVHMEIVPPEDFLDRTVERRDKRDEINESFSNWQPDGQPETNNGLADEQEQTQTGATDEMDNEGQGDTPDETATDDIVTRSQLNEEVQLRTPEAPSEEDAIQVEDIADIEEVDTSHPTQDNSAPDPFFDETWFATQDELAEIDELDRMTQMLAYEELEEGQVSSILYQNAAFEHADMHMIPQRSGVKEEIILRDKPVEESIQYTLSLENLTPKLMEDGSIQFFDNETKEQKGGMHKPFMYDSSEDGNYSEKVWFELAEDGDERYSLILKYDMEYFEDATYPVIIDPTTYLDDYIHQTGSSGFRLLTTYIRKDSPDQHFGAYGYFNVSESSQEQWGVLWFDLKEANAWYVPKNDEDAVAADDNNYCIMDVTLDLYEVSGGSGQQTMYMTKMDRNNWVFSTMTWANAPAQIRQSGNVIAYKSDIKIDKGTNKKSTINMTDLVFADLRNNSQDNNGYYFRVQNGGDLRFASSFHSNNNYKPRVFVKRLGNQAAPSVTTRSEGANSGKTYMDLSWTHPANKDGSNLTYNVLRSEDNVNFYRVNTSPISGTSYTDIVNSTFGANRSGDRYYYKVQPIVSDSYDTRTLGRNHCASSGPVLTERNVQPSGSMSVNVQPYKVTGSKIGLDINVTNNLSFWNTSFRTYEFEIKEQLNPSDPGFKFTHNAGSLYVGQAAQAGGKAFVSWNAIKPNTQYTVYVRAYDTKNNYATTSFTATPTPDNIPPTPISDLQIWSPDPNNSNLPSLYDGQTWTSFSNLTFKFKGGDDNLNAPVTYYLEIEHNGNKETKALTGATTPSLVDGWKTFNTDVRDYADGQFKFSIYGVDDQDNVGSNGGQYATYRLDREFPVVEIEGLENNMTLYGNVEIKGIMSDISMQRWSVQIKNNLKDQAYTTIAEGTNSIDTVDTLASIHSTQYEEGLYTLLFTAKDAPHEEVTKMYQVYIVNASKREENALRLDAPEPEAILGPGNVEFAFSRVNRKSLVGLDDATLYIDGKPVAYKDSDLGMFETDISQLEDGKHYAYIKANGKEPDADVSDPVLSYATSARYVVAHHVGPLTDNLKAVDLAQTSGLTFASDRVHLELAGGVYAPGVLQMNEYGVLGHYVESVHLDYDATLPAGTSLQAEYSDDEGQTWHALGTPGQTGEIPLQAAAGKIIVRVRLLPSADGLQTPAVQSIDIEYGLIAQGQEFSLQTLKPVSYISAIPNVNFTVAISWKASEEADVKYNVYRREKGSQDEAQLIAEEIEQTYWNDHILNYGTQYEYWVTVVKEFTDGRGKRVSPPSSVAVCRVVDKDELDKRLGLQDHWTYTAFETGSGIGYVNASAGNLVYQSTDIVNSAPLMAMVMNRTFNSQASYKTALGYGWDFSFNTVLLVEYKDGHVQKVEDPDDDGSPDYDPNVAGLILKDGDGTMHRFTKETDGNGNVSYKRPAGIRMDIRKAYNSQNEYDGYIIDRYDGVQYKFSKDMRIDYFADLRGNKMSMEYDENGGRLRRVQSILATENLSDPHIGDYIEFTYTDESTHQNEEDFTVPLGLIATANLYTSEMVNNQAHYTHAFTVTYDYKLMEYNLTKFAALSSVKVTENQGGVKTTVGEDYYYESNASTQVDTNAYKLVAIRDAGNYMNHISYHSDGKYVKSDKIAQVRKDIGNNQQDNYAFAYTEQPDGSGHMNVTVRGNTTQIGYTSWGGVSYQVDALGNKQQFTYSEQTPDYRKLAISYQNNLNGAGTKTYTTQYEYDERQNLRVAIDEQGNRSEYDFDTSKPYCSPTAIRVPVDIGVTAETLYRYDAYGSVISEKVLSSTAGGKQYQQTTYNYDGNGNRTSAISVINGISSTSKYSYDFKGRLVQSTNPLGGIESVQQYDTLNNPTKIKDVMGRVTEMEYNSLNRLVKTKYHDGTLMEYQYYTNGLVSYETFRKSDGASDRTQFTSKNYEYDGLGRVRVMREGIDGSTVDKATQSYVTRYGYSGPNESEPWVQVVDPSYRMATTYYDKLGRVKREKAGGATSLTTSYRYDNIGNVTEVVAPDGIKTQMLYDVYGNVTQETTLGTNGDTISSSYTYDLAGNVKRATDPLGKYTDYDYDVLGRLTSVNQEGNVGGSDIRLTTAYEYDIRNAGLLGAKATDASGGMKVDYVNAMGWTVKSIDEGKNASDASRHINEYAYNADGTMRAHTREDGSVVNYAYDDMGRLTKTTYPDERTIENEYDWKSQRISMKDTTKDYYNGQGKRVMRTEWEYDVLGRNVMKRQGEWRDGVFNNSVQVNYQYDLSDNITEMYYANSGYDSQETPMKTGYAYDELGRLTLVSLAGKKVESYEYDKTTGRLNNAYEYINFESNPVGVDTEFIRREYDYDAFGDAKSVNYKLTKGAKNDELVEAYTVGQRDKRGYILVDEHTDNYTKTANTVQMTEVVERREKLGEIGSSESVMHSTIKRKEYRYDAQGKLLSSSMTNEHEPQMNTRAEYTYDEVGNRTKVDEYNVDKLEFTRTEGDSTGYVARKHMTYMTVGTTAQYSYDEFNQLNKIDQDMRVSYTRTVNQGIKHEESFGKSPDRVIKDQPIDKRIPAYLDSETPGVETGTSELTNVHGYDIRGYKEKSSTTFTYDGRGNQTQSVTTITESDKADILREQQEEYQIAEGTWNLPGMPEPKDVGMQAVVNYEFDAANQLIRTEEPDKGKTGPDKALPQKKNNETQLEKAERERLEKEAEDNKKREQHLEERAKTVHFYNGDGQRSQKVTWEGATNYIYAGDALLGTVNASGAADELFILSPDGRIIASYQMGKGFNKRRFYFYHYDFSGSVLSIVNPNGEQEQGYQYSDFGETKEKVNEETKANVTNEVKYAGAVEDKETGLYYMNARHYNPQTGRFIQEDTYRGSVADPMTQHLYAYCGNNPVNYIDPTGHAAEGTGGKKNKSWEKQIESMAKQAASAASVAHATGSTWASSAHGTLESAAASTKQDVDYYMNKYGGIPISLKTAGGALETMEETIARINHEGARPYHFAYKTKEDALNAAGEYGKNPDEWERVYAVGKFRDGYRVSPAEKVENAMTINFNDIRKVEDSIKIEGGTLMAVGHTHYKSSMYNGPSPEDRVFANGVKKSFGVSFYQSNFDGYTSVAAPSSEKIKYDRHF